MQPSSIGSCKTNKHRGWLMQFKTNLGSHTHHKVTYTHHNPKYFGKHNSSYKMLYKFSWMPHFKTRTLYCHVTSKVQKS